MIELVAPAGNAETLDAAVRAGADAVYLGLKSFNARMRSENFTWAQYQAAAEALHKRGKKVFVTLNTIIEENELESLYRILAFLDRNRPDAIIVQDFGALQMARAHFPRLRVHASTQMNICSSRAVNVLGRSGVSRVVLSRELALEEIRGIRASASCELEVFAHGALCVSESGLCLFSSFYGGKSANRGMCTQGCRRPYIAEGDTEKQRGSFFSMRDLQLIDAVPDLAQAGVNALKIEGRMKSAEYVGAVVSAYRYMLDNWEADRRAAVAAAKRILADDFAREKTRYWIGSSPPESALNPEGPAGTGLYLGAIARAKADGQLKASGAQLAVISGGRYQPEVGDTIRLHKKDGERRESWKIKAIIADEGKKGRGACWIDIPQGFSVGDEVYLLQTKAMSKRFPRVLPKSLIQYKDRPRGEALPALAAPAPKDSPPKKKGKRRGDEPFPEGVYAQVSSPQDFYTALILNPVRIAAVLSEKMLQFLLGESAENAGEGAKPLPLSKKAIIVSLPPFFPQSEENRTAEAVALLLEAGYRSFIANNAGHLGLMRAASSKLKGEQRLFVAAGPYLYSFNSRAAAWLKEQGASAFVSPYENSRANLEAAFPPESRRDVILPVFAYPALFRMRFNKPASYDFEWLTNKRDELFRLVECESGGCAVLPGEPYSIADKKALLERLGFARVLFDFADAHLSKKDARAIAASWLKGEPLASLSRFNWKEGFYQEKRPQAAQLPARKE